VKLKTPTRKPEIQETGDRRIYTWVVKDIKPERDKDKDEADEDAGPDVQLTTFTDWKQVAQWYAKLQGERMTVDDSVRKKAEELTKGADTPTEKARRLYDFVARNVRYVSISLGIGRYQPHSPRTFCRMVTATARTSTLCFPRCCGRREFRVIRC
jgi:transglutaminase-like putative cysteine protease